MERMNSFSSASSGRTEGGADEFVDGMEVLNVLVKVRVDTVDVQVSLIFREYFVTLRELFYCEVKENKCPSCKYIPVVGHQTWQPRYDEGTLQCRTPCTTVVSTSARPTYCRWLMVT